MCCQRSLARPGSSLDRHAQAQTWWLDPIRDAPHGPRGRLVGLPLRICQVDEIAQSSSRSITLSKWSSLLSAVDRPNKCVGVGILSNCCCVGTFLCPPTVQWRLRARERIHQWGETGILLARLSMRRLGQREAKPISRLPNEVYLDVRHKIKRRLRIGTMILRTRRL